MVRLRLLLPSYLRRVLSGQAARARRLRLRLRSRASLSPGEQWARDGGEQLRLGSLGLCGSDVVFDFGGYVGDWAAEIVSRYGCKVHLFEPVPQFAARSSERFVGDTRVVVHPFGIAALTRPETLRLADDATGSAVQGAPVLVEFQHISFLDSLGLDRVALAKINIEGGEYELLPSLADAGWIQRIDRFFIQFHHISSDSERLRTTIADTLQKTHHCDWNYPFVWESWTRLNDPNISNAAVAAE